MTKNSYKFAECYTIEEEVEEEEETLAHANLTRVQVYDDPAYSGPCAILDTTEYVVHSGNGRKIGSNALHMEQQIKHSNVSNFPATDDLDSNCKYSCKQETNEISNSKCASQDPYVFCPKSQNPRFSDCGSPVQQAMEIETAIKKAF